MRPEIWTFVGSASAGTSALAASVAVALGQRGSRTVAVDGGERAGRLAAQLGVDPASEGDAPQQTPHRNVRLLFGARSLGPAEDGSLDQDRLTGFEADFVLVDVGTGSGAGAIDLFHRGDQSIVVISPQPPSPQEGYGFVKRAVFQIVERELASDHDALGRLKEFRSNTFRSKDCTLNAFFAELAGSAPELAQAAAAALRGLRPWVAIHGADSDYDSSAGEIVQATARKFLSIDPLLLGVILGDRPIPLDTAAGWTSPVGLDRALSALLEHRCGRTSERVEVARPAGAAPIMGLNDDIEVGGAHFHVQTEDLGPRRRAVTTQVFSSGRIMMSRRTEYAAEERAQVVEIMRKQHLDVIKEFTDKSGGAPRPAG
jgi:hypothetical protein